ncbi:MAG: methyltransferase domain-containing protein [Planctomycetes bacterium]|nr:methyltransferase domain-containing protein [Planctomycetota bacterium]
MPGIVARRRKGVVPGGEMYPMNPDAMRPFGSALLAYARGDTEARLVIRRDDGTGTPIPAAAFFRDESEFTLIDRLVLENCAGAVLDIGAGTGRHSVALQRRGFRVTAIDVCPEAVSVMRTRGLADVHCADMFTFRGGPYDTLLLLGHGIGMVETIAGLDRFLGHARSLLHDGGRVLLDSLDVRATDDADNLAYQEANRSCGRYAGEIRMRFEFQGVVGPSCGWLHVDPGTLTEHAAAAQWTCDVLLCDATGNYLARLTSARAA